MVAPIPKKKLRRSPFGHVLNLLSVLEFGFAAVILVYLIFGLTEK
jgi:hypothetical protein